MHNRRIELMLAFPGVDGALTRIEKGESSMRWIMATTTSRPSSPAGAADSHRILRCRESCDIPPRPRTHTIALDRPRSAVRAIATGCSAATPKGKDTVLSH